MPPVLRALGLMTGTSLDGVDAAVIDTDGVTVTRRGALTEPFSAADAEVLRDAVASALRWGFEGPEPNVFAQAEALITERCAAAATRLIGEAGPVDIIGLHGQTVLHRAPEPGRPGATRQLADGPALARALGVDVVYDFRAADIAAGGQGAPLAPVYHAALLRALSLPTPLAVLNVGGVANLSWWDGQEGLVGFDTGPGNGPLDEWVRRHTGAPFDADGALAASGRVDDTVLAALLADPYFAERPPKSLDRYAFDTGACDVLSPADGAATLTAFCAEGVARSLALVAAPPRAVFVGGGGARNRALMRELRARLPCGVLTADDAGWRVDTLEAELMAYLAVRSLYELPITFPGTTGAPRPLTGGVLARGE
ncbi:MAG: anhydro-N-acetylmuramic acid kinase [Caulobacterales bacterium]|nr:anhydro-N-acetylmuramic acid kinase [Caulobacterales bacterium]